MEESATLTLKDVRSLAEHESRRVVSIFMPTHRCGPDSQENVIRFKNRIAEAEKRLRASGVAPADIQRQTDPARRLLVAGGFWRRQGDGLAVFLDPDVFRTYQLAVRLEELTVVDRNFQITPLLSAVECSSEYYVLAISRRHVRLLRGSRVSVNEVALPGAPEGVDESYFDDDTSDQFRSRTIAGVSAGRQEALFHGQGGTERPQKERISHYFRRIDEGVSRAIRDTAAPLVFAGDVSLFPLYKELNTYGELCDQFVAGIPDALSGEELRAQAWPLVKETLDAVSKEAVARVSAALSVGQGTSDTTALVRSAIDGRIDVFVLAIGAHQWGRFQSDTGQIQVLPERESDSQDLLNLAARHALLRGGRVLAIQSHEMPTEAPAAASFRFDYKE